MYQNKSLIQSFFQIIRLILILASLTPINLPANELDNSIIGKWYTEDQRAIFDFYRKKNTICARLIPLEKPDMIDSKNPLDSLKTRPIKNTTTVWGLTYNLKKKQWDDGKVYNPTDGKTYSCACRLIDNGNKLEFRGYIGIALLGQNKIWTRCK